MKGFLLTLLILLQVNCSNREQSKPNYSKESKEIIKFNNSSKLKLTSDIRSIFQDSKDHYWFGSHSEGVAHYDGISFEYYTVNDGLANNQIRSIKEDIYGNIWFGTANGVSSYDGQKIKTYTEHGYDEAKWEITDTNLWFNAGTREGVLRYDGQNLFYLPFPDSKRNVNGNVYAVTGISEGKDNMVWFSTYAGVIGYNGNKFSFINDKTLGSIIDEDLMHVRSILEDSKGRLWIGNNGIGVLLKENNSIINLSKKHGKLLSMNEFENNYKTQQLLKNNGLQSVFAIEEDGAGNIWFGDRDSGAWKYDGKSLRNYSIDDKVSSTMICSIYKDNRDNLLIGMAGGRVYRFNGKGFEKQF